MKTVRRIDSMIKIAREIRSNGNEIGFVPTMGALHEGHLTLFKKAGTENDFLIASIFVNPIQFCPGEDFDRYPRDYEKDFSLADQESVDLLFLPEASDMYQNQLTNVIVTGMEDKLCGSFRPGHFQGVATVALKLFNIISPDRSYFGEKDYQQLFMLKKMARDLNLNTQVIGCPTVREKDGLALSSRNRYLGKSERERALSIYDSICSAKKMVRDGERRSAVIEGVIKERLKGSDVKIDYAVVCSDETLEKVDYIEGGARVFIAGSIGSTHLIDNDLLED